MEPEGLKVELRYIPNWSCGVTGQCWKVVWVRRTQGGTPKFDFEDLRRKWKMASFIPLLLGRRLGREENEREMLLGLFDGRGQVDLKYYLRSTADCRSHRQGA